MSLHRRAGVLVSTALLASGLTAIGAVPASAADSWPPLVVAGDVVDESGNPGTDGSVDLYTRGADGSVVKVHFTGWIYEYAGAVSTSPDGTRVAYVVYSAGATPRETLYVADVAGRFSRIVESVSGDDFFGRPSFSPDGASIAYPRFVDATSSQQIRKAPVVSGAPVTIPGTQGLYSVTWTSASEMLAMDFSRGLVRLPVGGATAGLTQVGGASSIPGGYLTSAPGGSRISVLDDEYGGFLTTAAYSASAGALTDIVAVTSGPSDADHSFSLDGQTLFFTRCPNECASGADFRAIDVWQVPASGGTAATQLYTSTGPEYGVAPATLDAIAPEALTMGTASLAATTARIPVGAAPSDLSGVLVTRKVAGATTNQKTDAYLPVSGGAFTDTGLVLGTTYEYSIKGVDRSNNTGPASATTKLLTATEAPRFTISDPTSKTQVRTAFPVALTTANKAGTRYTIDYRNMAGTTFARWKTDTTAKSFSGTSAFGAGNVPAAVAPGAVYQFRASAKDAYGNSTAAPVSTAKAVVPFDQTKAVISSTAASATGADRWMGSVRSLGAAGQKATLTVIGDRFQVIGERNTNGGRFDVYVKNSSGVFAKLTGTPINTYAAARSARQVLYTFTAGTVASRTFEIRWVTGSSSTRNKVVLDGFAARR